MGVSVCAGDAGKVYGKPARGFPSKAVELFDSLKPRCAAAIRIKSGSKCPIFALKNSPVIGAVFVLQNKLTKEMRK